LTNTSAKESLGAFVIPYYAREHDLEQYGRRYLSEAIDGYAIEANAYGKPVLALDNGGLNDIIVNQVNGFLAKTPQDLQQYVERVYECSPDSCRESQKSLYR
jgi:glycosyltransferase involved in cell wall biosynthesis